jgi:RNA polymerase sigma-70 factor (ECF subfamily)
MSNESSFVDLIERLRAGDPDAATLIFRRYAKQLICLARHRLDQVILQKVDPEDVLQSVFRTFFRRQADGKIRLEGWHSLWGILAIITVRKCAHQNRHYRTQAHNARKEVNVDAAPYWAEAGVSWEAVAREPTPADAAILAETLEQAFAELDPRDKEILRLSLRGHSTTQISEQVERTERTVQRVLERVRARLEKQVRAGPVEG